MSSLNSVYREKSHMNWSRKLAMSAAAAAVFAIAAADVIQWAAGRAWRRFLGVDDDR